MSEHDIELLDHIAYSLVKEKILKTAIFLSEDLRWRHNIQTIKTIALTNQNNIPRVKILTFAIALFKEIRRKLVQTKWLCARFTQLKNKMLEKKYCFLLC